VRRKNERHWPAASTRRAVAGRQTYLHCIMRLVREVARGHSRRGRLLARQRRPMVAQWRRCVPAARIGGKGATGTSQATLAQAGRRAARASERRNASHAHACGRPTTITPIVLSRRWRWRRRRKRRRHARWNAAGAWPQWIASARPAGHDLPAAAGAVLSTRRHASAAEAASAVVAVSAVRSVHGRG
jgi:hypothetical protein